MSKPTVGSLFSGIGGFDLGFERAGFEVRWQVEIDEFCRKVLAKHWPAVRRYDDVRTFPPQAAEDWKVDVIIGGFPCQDVSTAGRRKGIGEGTRSGLWSEYLRVVALLRPRFVVVENTPGILAPIRHKGKFVAPSPIGRVLGELSEIGFDAEWQVVPACAFGAPHVRERVFLVAYPAGHGSGSRVLPAGRREEGEGATDLARHGEGVATDSHVQRPLFANGTEAESEENGPQDGLLERGCPDPDRQGLAVRESLRGHPREEQQATERSRRADRVNPEPADAQSVGGLQGAAQDDDALGSGNVATEPPGRGSPFVGSGWWGAEPDVVRMVHGVPRRVVRPAITGLGNAVVPEVAEWVARCLMHHFTNGHGRSQLRHPGKA